MIIKSITKKVDNLSILDNISIDFGNRGMVFIVGKSGAGKTSLLNIISGVDNEYDGDVCIDLETVDKKQKDEFRKNVGVIFQDFNLINNLTVEENIRIGRRMLGYPDDEELLNTITKKLDIDNLYARKTDSLSGGERQRIAIARALYRENEIIFADEPTGNLDENNSTVIFDLLKDISSEKLCIIVSHDMEAAYKYADRIIEISDGAIIGDIVLSKVDDSRKSAKKDASSNKKSIWVKKYIKDGILNTVLSQKGAIVMMTIAMILVMGILGFVNASNRMIDSIDSSVLENDKYIMEYNSFDEKDGYQRVKNACEKFGKIKNIKEIVCYNKYTFIPAGTNGVDGNNTGDNDYDIEVIKDDEFFQNRYSEFDCLPKEYEVVVDTEFAKQKFGSAENATGKYINLESNYGIDYKLKICAVRPKYGIDSKFMISDKMNQIMTHDIVKEELSIGLDENVDVSFSVKSTDELSTDNLLAGNSPHADNELVVSLSVANDLIRMVDAYRKMIVAKDFVEADDETLGSLDILFNNTYCVGNFGFIGAVSGYKIVGIVDDKVFEDSDGENYGVYMNVDAFENIGIYNSVSVYVDSLDKNAIEEIKDIANNNDLFIINNVTELAMTIGSILNSVSLIMGIIAVIVLIIPLMMISYHMKESIIRRQYEIGVLRSLGAGKKDIRKILISEQMVVALTVVILSALVMIVVVSSGIKNHMTMYGVCIYKPSVIHVIMVSLISTITVYLTSAKWIKRAANIDISDALKEKYKI